jgi:hypothetical protein
MIGLSPRRWRFIENLQDDQGRIYYRACGGGICRYCEDLWQARLYADQLRSG